MSKRVFKRPSIATDAAKNSNPILGQLFSPEFMNNLKNELNKKVRSSKTIDETEDDISSITKKYEKQIHQLHSKVRKLNIQNEHLKKTLDLVSSGLQSQPRKEELSLKDMPLRKSEKLRIVPIEDLKIKIQDMVNTDVERQLLRERVRNLEDYKTMKEKRFSEMIAKGACYVEEINLLKYKNQELQSTIRSMRTTMISPTIVESIDLRANHSFKKHTTTFWNQISAAQTSRQNPQNSLKPGLVDSCLQGVDSQMLISHTANLVIPPEYDIRNMWKSKPRLQNSIEFNQIDYIIGQQLPYLNMTQQSMSQCSPANLNSSVVVIQI